MKTCLLLVFRGVTFGHQCGWLDWLNCRGLRRKDADKYVDSHLPEMLRAASGLCWQERSFYQMTHQSLTEAQTNMKLFPSYLLRFLKAAFCRDTDSFICVFPLLRNFTSLSLCVLISKMRKKK